MTRSKSRGAVLSKVSRTPSRCSSMVAMLSSKIVSTWSSIVV
ncbi:Uncharacterised protein [Mycobacterium tuberculosis]|uniref:Uncharacterized protein n=1 Tax=Mycobacterium tuberculosis TaxID=1773 RepID=A0A916LBS9_MYCTX|nr:Uncharacterised protein [Mycobacterium tuberculosis]COW61809.1 Uncharacterised protein [Mycobacterium tuberculosis]COY15623.1 Uncharacterised protein [Mycobacterium tuberculosis]